MTVKRLIFYRAITPLLLKGKQYLIENLRDAVTSRILQC